METREGGGSSRLSFSMQQYSTLESYAEAWYYSNIDVVLQNSSVSQVLYYSRVHYSSAWIDVTTTLVQ